MKTTEGYLIASFCAWLCILSCAGGGQGGAGTECDQDPIRKPNQLRKNVEEDAATWGVHCEGSAKWEMVNVETPALDGKALRLALVGGLPNANVHFYRFFPPYAMARRCTLKLSFRYDVGMAAEGAEAAPAPQALEFIMRKWQPPNLYEWRFQWRGIGEGALGWFYWNPHTKGGWVAMEMKGSVSPGEWHTLELEGRIKKSEVFYENVTLDGARHPIGVAVPPMKVGREEDRMAIGVQLDGNGMADAYDVVVDKVAFEN